jgi:hypothetical protein
MMAEQFVRTVNEMDLQTWSPPDTLQERGRSNQLVRVIQLCGA